MRRSLLALVAVVAAMLLGGCTGVPTSSSPSTIASVDVDSGAVTSPVAPSANADPRSIVLGFLENNTIDAKDHASARAFLSSQAKTDWNDQVVTVVDRTTIEVFREPTTNSLTVHVLGRVVGTVSANGVYTRGSDNAKDTEFAYRLAREAGHWRIVAPFSGLLIKESDFVNTFRLRPLYFFDLAHQFLVPDGRYSALTGDDLNAWLVNQVASGPRSDLVNAVTTDTLPSRRNITPTPSKNGGPLRIEIPGASQLDAGSKRRLAAQLGKTLNAVSPDQALQITDSDTAVSIPDVGDTFTYQSFGQDFDGPPLPDSDVYYLRDGHIAGQNGELIDGPLNRGTYYLNSIAMSRSGGKAELSVAGETSRGLVVGTENVGFGKVVLGGPLTSRPAWAPGRSEVWVGKGAKVYRLAVGADGRTASATEVGINSSTAGARITAIRISPEGSRIALVIRAGDGAQMFVGSIVRSAGQVRIDALQSISPDTVSITDLGWVGELKIFAVGRTRAVGEGEYFETNSDGAAFTSHVLDGLSLPGPDSLTVARQQQAWVSVDRTVWVQVGGTWKPAGGSTDQTPGDKPVYLE